MSDGVAPSKGAMKAAEVISRFTTLNSKNGVPWAAEVIDRETKSPQMAEQLSRSKTEHFAMAAQLDLWALQSAEGGWSTHQVDAMRRRADICRKYGAQAERLLSELEVKK